MRHLLFPIWILLRHQLIVAALVGLCAHRTLLWAFALALAVVAELLINEFVRINQAVSTAVRGSQELRALFGSAAPGCLRELSADEVSRYVTGDLEKELGFKFLGIRRAVTMRRREAGLPEHYPAVRIYAPVPSVTSPLLAQHTALITPLNSSQIVLASEPIEGDVLDRFKVLHELSHSTLAGMAITSERVLVPVRAGVLVVAAYGLAPTIWLPLAVTVAALLVVKACLFRGNTFAETYADMRALAAFPRSEATDIADTFINVWDTDQDFIAMRMARTTTRKEWRLIFRRGVEREERLHTMRLAQRVLQAGRKLGYQQPGPDLTPPGLILLTLVIIAVVSAQNDPTWFLFSLLLASFTVLRPKHLFRSYTLAYEAEFALERQLATLSSPQSSQAVSVSYSVTYPAEF